MKLPSRSFRANISLVRRRYVQPFAHVSETIACENNRLQHTLGVFSLVAHFCPENVLLRAAALLHDVGHAPFSHALERLDGVDHHL